MREHGFEIVADEDILGGCEFDMVIVIRASDGSLWAAKDRGCSCYAPFEQFVWPRDFDYVHLPQDVIMWEGRHPLQESRIRDAVKAARWR